MSIELKQAAQQAAEAIDWMLNVIRRDAPQISGKAMGNAEKCATDLRAAIQQPATGDPVGQVSDLFPSVRNKLHAKGFGSDAPLYTHPAVVPEDVQRDAERYRWLRASTFPKADQYPYRISTKPIRLPIGFDDQSTFDAAIDAAMLATIQAQKGQP